MKKKPEEFALEYAGFWIRLVANIIDLFILLLIPFSAYCMVSGFVLRLPLLAISVPKIAFILWFIITIVYFAGFWVWRGQTLGKMITGIKVIRTDSSPIEWKHALLRYLGYIISAMALCIGFIWIAFDSHKQGFHDKIADTYVVKLPVRQVKLAGSYAGGGGG